jgi:glycosyltransferase involved in cell wall biosynthesis
MAGYPGQVDVFIARILANLRNKPLVWDVFMSLYLIAKERKLDQKKGTSVYLIRKIEAKALKKPDLLIQDTAEYVKWFQKEYDIQPERFRLVPTGADNRIFKPLPTSKPDDGLFHVLYYGTFIPNHGVMHIVKAAQQLRDEEEIIFDMIGDGPERKKAEEFVENNNLNTVHFQDWMEQEKLVEVINSADICLGAFGDTPQSLMTVQNKIYECMAMGKVIITGESPAVRNGFIHKEDIFICERQAHGIAKAIKTLKINSELREKIGKNAMKKFNENYSLESLGGRLRNYLYNEFF